MKYDYRYLFTTVYFVLFLCVTGYTTANAAQQSCSQVKQISVDNQPQLTIAAFGGAEVDVRVVPPLPDVLITANTNANVRNGPSTEASVMTSLQPSQIAQAVARNSDGSWLRIVLPDRREGWIAAKVVTISGDLFELPERSTNELSPIEADVTIQMSPSETCADAQGIVVHAPFPSTWQSIAVNGFVLEFVGTLHLSFHSETLIVQVPSGLVKIAVPELTVFEGGQVSLSSDIAKSEVVPYELKQVEVTSQYLCENSDIFSLDQGCFLTVAPPYDETALIEAETLQAPMEGEWLQTVVRDEITSGASRCPSPYHFSPGTISHTFLERNEDNTLVHHDVVNYTRLRSGIYQWVRQSIGSRVESELQITTPLRATLKVRSIKDTGCIITREYSLEFYRPFPILPVALPLPSPGLWRLEITDVTVSPEDCRSPYSIGFTRTNMLYTMYGGLLLGPSNHGYLIEEGIYHDYIAGNIGTQQEQEYEIRFTILDRSEVLSVIREIQNNCETVATAEFQFLEALDTVLDGTWSVSIDDPEDATCKSSELWFVNRETLQLNYASDRIELIDSERGTSIFVRDTRILNQLDPNIFEFRVSTPTFTKQVRLEILSDTEIRLQENAFGSERSRPLQCQGLRTATLRHLGQP